MINLHMIIYIFMIKPSIFKFLSTSPALASFILHPTVQQDHTLIQVTVVNCTVRHYVVKFEVKGQSPEHEFSKMRV